MSPDPLLFWEHGTLLQPQHFQLLDRSVSNRAALAMDMTGPWPWGVLALGVDEQALRSGQIALTRLDAVLPAGEHLVLGENACVEPKSCSSEWPDPDAPLLVYLGLPAARPDAANVTEAPTLNEASRASTRYVATHDPEVVPESLAGGERADVRFMRYNAKLVLENETERLRSMACMPLLRLVRRGEDVVVDRDWVPPCLDTTAFPVLDNALKSVRNALAGRLYQLEEFKLSSRDTAGRAGRQPLTLQTLATHAMVQALSRCLPLVEHLCEAPRLHPWMAYGLLRQVVGELSVFSPSVSALGQGGDTPLPPYSHTAPAPCFIAAQKLVAHLVGLLATGPAHVFVMERQGHFWSATLPDHARTGFDFWLQVRTENRDYLAALGHLGLRFASEDRMADLLSRSLPGIPLTREDPPSGLPRREDTVYLAVSPVHELWIPLQRSGRAVFFLPQAPEDTTVHLILVTPAYTGHAAGQTQMV